MGEKIPSVRTLPTGEKVTHYPSGEQVLQPTNSLADVLGEQEQNLQDASQALVEANLTRVEEKRERQESGTPVPADKSPV
ncbi:hypothetical protein MYRNA_189 [Mycobacterium phage Myrna]|uniref:Uncharacterized protein n=1 Tax=Mycobacterium phage Myrna TaxID=546805 RepID=B5LJG1_9CAUD|nr:gp189 [Mycobacterium phage Myrna]ACH62158.1 hypothetical protein MYRNA_189 [Mycobacterium phage Myrna]